MAEVLAVCVVHQLLPDRGIGATAIDKRPVDRPLRVRKLGLHGDVQADREHHGGPDQAVYAYAEEDAAHFAAQLGRDIPPGAFGENLRTRGADVTGAVIGERWRIGGVVLEVTSPRNPCGTFERRMRLRGWQERFREYGAPGAYFRVIRAGDVRAGDAIEVVDRPTHGVTIGGWFSRHDPADAQALLDAEAAGAVRIQEDVHRHIAKALKGA
ncbi:MOSC domain-containing protein [Amnibacterium kyonggiense]